MPVNVFPAPSTGASLTPFDAPFSYTWGTARDGINLTLDLTNAIPAGTYTATVTHQATAAPAKIELLDANNNVIASTTTLTIISTTSISGVLTATGSFTKIRLSGSSLGSTVSVSSSNSVSLSSGTRTVSVVTYWDRIKSGSNVVRHTNHPTTSPDATYSFACTGWYFNNKLYFLMADRDQDLLNSNTGTSNFRVYAWDYGTSTWSSNLGTTVSATTIFSTDYKFYGNWQWTVYTYKNGNVLLRPQYLTVNNGTFAPTSKALFFNLSGNTTSVITFSDATHGALGSQGASCYNSVNDEWYFTGGAVYNSQAGSWTNGGGIVRFSNSGTASTASTSNSWGPSYQEDNQLFVENVANPRMYLIQTDTGNNLRGYYYATFGNTNVGSDSGTASTNGTSQEGYPMTGRHRSKQMIPMTINGVDGYMYSPENTQPQGVFGPITTFSPGSFTAGSNFSSFPIFSNRTNWLIQPEENESGDGTTVYQLGPINSTTIGAVKFNSLRNGVYGAVVIPSPSTVTF